MWTHWWSASVQGQRDSKSDFNSWLLLSVKYWQAVNPLTLCYIITSNGLIALFTCFTQVLPYQTYCLLDPNTKVWRCVYSAHCLLNIAWRDGMLMWPSAFIPPGSGPHQTIIGCFLPLSVTLDSFLCNTVVAISCLPLVLLAIMFLPDTSVFSYGGTYSASTCQNHSGGPFSEGALLCNSALSLSLATEFWQTYNILHSVHREQNSVLVASVEAVII